MSADFPPGRYGMIMADPPWHFQTRTKAGGARSPQAKYQTMTMDAIARLPVASIAARDCLLWLWFTGPVAPQALMIADAWGFDFVTMGWWAKSRMPDPETAEDCQMGTGYWLRNTGEPFLIAKRGHPPVVARDIRSTIIAPRREHSRKPDSAFAAAQRMAPGVSRIELFSRQSRPGWDVWGMEAGKFDEREVS